MIDREILELAKPSWNTRKPLSFLALSANYLYKNAYLFISAAVRETSNLCRNIVSCHVGLRISVGLARCFSDVNEMLFSEIIVLALLIKYFMTFWGFWSLANAQVSIASNCWRETFILIATLDLALSAPGVETVFIAACSSLCSGSSVWQTGGTSSLDAAVPFPFYLPDFVFLEPRQLYLRLSTKGSVLQGFSRPIPVEMQLLHLHLGPEATISPKALYEPLPIPSEFITSSTSASEISNTLFINISGSACLIFSHTIYPPTLDGLYSSLLWKLWYSRSLSWCPHCHFRECTIKIVSLNIKLKLIITQICSFFEGSNRPAEAYSNVTNVDVLGWCKHWTLSVTLPVPGLN